MNNRPKTPHGFARLIIGDGSAVSEQKNIIWNMIGSFLYAFASMVLSIAVVQLAGEDAGGVFTFAFTTFGQHMFMVAYFGIRPFHITDTRQKYTFRRISAPSLHYLRPLRCSSDFSMWPPTGEPTPVRRQ